jgi:hypothetical protein
MTSCKIALRCIILLDQNFCLIFRKKPSYVHTYIRIIECHTISVDGCTRLCDISCTTYIHICLWYLHPIQLIGNIRPSYGIHCLSVCIHI